MQIKIEVVAGTKELAFTRKVATPTSGKMVEVLDRELADMCAKIAAMFGEQSKAKL